MLNKYSFAMAALVLLPAIGMMVVPQAAPAQSVVQLEPERTLSVTGSGIEMIPTTLTEVSLGVLVEAETAQAAQQDAASRSTEVVEWLRSQNVEKLATTGISLNPRYDRVRDRSVIVGYEATNTVTFRLPTEAAGEVMDEAVGRGATTINGVSFVADDAAIAAARSRALESATQDARAQANTVLSALGLSPEEVVNVTIGAVSAPPPNANLQRFALESVSSQSSPVIGGEQTISAQVTLRIRY